MDSKHPASPLPAVSGMQDGQALSGLRGSSLLTVIEPPKGLIAINLAELWRYRELFSSLIWRDISVRYKQTLLGISWAVIGPVASTVIFTLIFGGLAHLKTDGLPAPVYYMTGLTIWRYFQNALTAASGSLVNNQNLLTKIYFPRVIIPVATILSNLVDLIIGLVILFAVMLWYWVIPDYAILLMPLLVLIATGTALGVGLFFAALYVRYRDVVQLIPFLAQLWMYCTVIIPFSEFTKHLEGWGWGGWRYLYGLNPMGGVVEGFRWCLARHYMKPAVEAPWILIAIGAAVMALFLLGGLYYFRRVESQFADVV
ncbi:MAG: ABC transporter permease [Candidatus Sumerlaeota bacterium]|nr:ABC transporter permease [Candidatus Sumerlaeota bacterium]